MSKVWFTSDLHIGHKRVSQIRAAAVKLMYATADQEANDRFVTAWHDSTVASNWDAMVDEDDVVWVLGDISVGGKKAELNALQWLSERPGEKHLIAGNHDSVHPKNRDAHKWFANYMFHTTSEGETKPVFKSIAAAGRRKITIREGEHQEVLLSHFPYEGDSGATERDVQWRLRDGGLPIIHGHTHSGEKVSRSSHQEPACWVSEEGTACHYANAKQIHIGLDAWDLKPVALEQIGELLL